jgi:hypothetical protein
LIWASNDGDYGDVLTTESELGLTFAREYRPWWTWELAVVIFPVGYLFLFVPEIALVTVVLEPEKSGTLVRVAGVGEGQPGFRVHGVLATASPLVASIHGTAAPRYTAVQFFPQRFAQASRRRRIPHSSPGSEGTATGIRNPVQLWPLVPRWYHDRKTSTTLKRERAAIAALS